MTKQNTSEEGTLGNQDAGDAIFDQAFDVAEGASAPVTEPVEPSAAPDPPPAQPDHPVVNQDEQQPGESDEKYEQRYRSLVGVHKHDKEAWESERAALLAKVEEVSKAAVAPTKEEPAKPSGKSTYESILDSLTPEQKAELDEYEADFDIVSKMEGLKREKAMEAFEKKLQQFQEEILSKLTPAENLLSQVAVEREVQLKEKHFGSISGVHPDYEQYRDDGSILNWIESKPGYLKKGMLETYQQGEASEVADLITDFKRENNIEIVRAPEYDPQVTNLQAKREAKRMAMQSVTGRRGSVNANIAAAADFEGAFEEALNK